MTRSFAGMKLKHIATVMDALVGLIQKDDFPLTELILAENKLKNDIHDFINALGSNQSLQKLGEYKQYEHLCLASVMVRRLPHTSNGTSSGNLPHQQHCNLITAAGNFINTQTTQPDGWKRIEKASLV